MNNRQEFHSWQQTNSEVNGLFLYKSFVIERAGIR